MRVKIALTASLTGLFILAFLYDAAYTPPALSKITEEKTSPIFLENSKSVPAFSFSTLEGQMFNDFSTLKEPIVLLNFWATWCTACVVELPNMLRLVKKHKGQVALVAISIDDTLPPVQTFLKKMARATQGLTQQPHVYWVWDKNKAISLPHFNTFKVPETIVLNAERRMVKKIVGEADWTTPPFLKALINAQP